MDYLATISIWLASLAAILSIGIGIMVWLSQKKNMFHTSFMLAAVFIGLWVASNILFRVLDDYGRYPVALLSYAFAMGSVVHIFIFTIYLSSINRIINIYLKWFIVFFGYSVGALSLIPGFIAYGVKDSSILTNKIILAVYGVVIGLYILASFVVLFYSQLRLHTIARKRNIKVINIGLIASSVAAIFFNLFLPLSGEYRFVQLGPASSVVFIGVIAYSIVKRSLFDIKFAVIRTVTYVVSLGAVVALYFISAYAISRYIFGEVENTFARGPADIALVVFAALLFQPVKNFFDKVTNKIFFKDNYSSSEFFAQLNRIITLTTDLRSLLVGSANEIAETLKIEQVSFVAVKQNDRIITAGTDKYNRIPKEDVDKIDEYIVSRGSATLVKSLLNEDKVEHEMARLMTSHKLEIIVPLLLSDKRIGYLCLGDKEISKFNRRDVGIMEAVADELTIAIQNALAIQEIREFNETLQQRVANATRELRKNNTMLRKLDKAKDEFVGMASHQLRTPLTSIKGYISMVLEGDAGKISEQQKHLLNEAFISSERMVHLIGDFLNVSRIQTGRFTIERTPVDLSKVVQQEVETLQSSAKARNLEYKYERPKDFPTLDLDESKLRQVIMNFADNALYYSRENSVIDVDLRVEGSDIVYTVKDTGIGVPKEEQDDLFTKFFRASNARIQRPDGTGVGLYLAKRIITGHGGKVIFKSVEGKGSTFGFRLPIK